VDALDARTARGPSAEAVADNMRGEEGVEVNVTVALEEFELSSGSGVAVRGAVAVTVAVTVAVGVALWALTALTDTVLEVEARPDAVTLAVGVLVGVTLGLAPLDSVAVGVGEPLCVLEGVLEPVPVPLRVLVGELVTDAVCDAEPLLLGVMELDSPLLTTAVGVMDKDGDKVNVGVVVMDAVPEAVGVRVLVGVPVCVPVGLAVWLVLRVVVGELVPLSEPVAEGLAPRESEPVGDADTVLERLEEVDAVMLAVPVPVDVDDPVPLGVGVIEGVGDGEALGEVDSESVLLSLPVADAEAPVDKDDVGEALRLADSVRVEEGELLGVCVWLAVPLLVGVFEGVPEPLAVHVCEDVGLGVWLPLSVDVEDPVPLLDPVEEGLAPCESDAVGEADTVLERLGDVEGVTLGVQLEVGVEVSVAVGELLKEVVVEGVVLSLPVEDGETPNVRDEVGVALWLAVSVGVLLLVALPVPLLVGVWLDVAVGELLNEAGVERVSLSLPVGGCEAPDEDEKEAVSGGVLLLVALPVPLAVGVALLEESAKVLVGLLELDGDDPVDADGTREGVPVGDGDGEGVASGVPSGVPSGEGPIESVGEGVRG
jgi:hypothetical protein